MHIAHRYIIHDLSSLFADSGTCNAHIGMGVRYNAEKKKIGMYYSTPIFSFRCKCHLCSGWFEIKTDPQVRPYALLFPTPALFFSDLISLAEHSLRSCL